MSDNLDESDVRDEEEEDSCGDEGTGGTAVVKVEASVGPTIMNLNDTKAGMTGLDSNRINKIIFEYSNGSHFHSFQTRRQDRIDQQIQHMKRRLTEMTEWQRNQCLKEADNCVNSIEMKRNMTSIIVHIDLDMFFAAVETKLKPELKGKPMAVGSDQMLATSNYEARKFGIRPGMPGALARRLCPQLILVKHSFGNYRRESGHVMAIIKEFDPNLYSMSLDECFIDLTDYVIDMYCQRNENFDKQTLKSCKELPICLWDLAAEVVSNIRQRILDETQLSASAGIACNTLIAKVCSDVNKPDGQHMIRGNKKEIEKFLEDTPIRKVNGIGPVRAQFLSAIGINTCKDLYYNRDKIRFAFSQFNAEYYLRVGLGIGRHVIERDEEPRKSVSSERTVAEVSTFEAICDYFSELSEELAEDLNSKNQSCKTITIKLKKITFIVTLKSHSLPYYTFDSETILNVAKNLLDTELKSTPIESRKYRLIGLKVSNLKSNETNRKTSSSQMTLSQIYRALKSNTNTEINTNSDKQSVEKPEEAKRDENESNTLVKDNNDRNESNFHFNQMYDSSQYECSVCFETFQHKNVFEDHENACIDEMLQISTSEPDISIDSEPNTSSHSNSSPQTNDESKDINNLCPICGTQLALKDNDELNAHIDVCLNKDKCLELTQVPLQSTTHNSTPKQKPSKRLYSDSKMNGKLSQKCDTKKTRKQSLKSQMTIDSFFNRSK